MMIMLMMVRCVCLSVAETCLIIYWNGFYYYIIKFSGSTRIFLHNYIFVQWNNFHRFRFVSLVVSPTTPWVEKDAVGDDNGCMHITLLHWKGLVKWQCPRNEKWVRERESVCICRETTSQQFCWAWGRSWCEWIRGGLTQVVMVVVCDDVTGMGISGCAKHQSLFICA